MIRVLFIYSVPKGGNKYFEIPLLVGKTMTASLARSLTHLHVAPHFFVCITGVLRRSSHHRQGSPRRAQARSQAHDHRRPGYGAQRAESCSGRQRAPGPRKLKLTLCCVVFRLFARNPAPSYRPFCGPWLDRASVCKSSLGGGVVVSPPDDDLQDSAFQPWHPLPLVTPDRCYSRPPSGLRWEREGKKNEEQRHCQEDMYGSRLKRFFFFPLLRTCLATVSRGS